MLTHETLREYCNQLPGAEETFPFGPHSPLVLKVMGKMFALIPLDLPHDAPPTVSLKCDPTWAQVLRSSYSAVQPGYHLNKKHWNTVTVDGSLSGDELRDMIAHSYDLVVKKLSKADRETLQQLNDDRN